MEHLEGRQSVLVQASRLLLTERQKRQARRLHHNKHQNNCPCAGSSGLRTGCPTMRLIRFAVPIANPV